MSDLPSGWAVATVGDTGDYINGLAFKPEDWQKEGRPIIRIQNLSGTSNSFNRTTREVDDRFVVRNGDLLVSWSATLDAFEWNGEDAVLNQHIFRVLPDGQLVEKAFLYWSLKYVIQQMWRSEHTHGSTMKHINRGPFLAHPFAVPPLAEQRRIVTRLEDLLARARRTRAALESIPPLLERFRQSMLTAAYKGRLTATWREATTSEAQGYHTPVEGLPEVPLSWTYETTANLVAPGTTITYGIVLPGPNQETGIPYIRGQDITDEGVILVEQLWRTTPEIASKHVRSEVREGDVLLCVIRHLRVAVAPSGIDGANLTQGTVRMRPSRRILAKYLAGYLESPQAQQWMKRKYVGMAMPRINVDHARRIPVPLPPIGEQHEIVRHLEALNSLRTTLALALEGAAAGAERLTTSILSKAFRGELVPQDPSDEPASVLIERIRAEREATGGNGKKRRGTRRSSG